MAKKAKQKQTEWNFQGKNIADTAVPYYQENLTRMNDYLSNPQAAMDDYLNKYYSNTAAQSDFLRNYNRAMSGTTAHNFAATGGGYDTSNQRNYDDMQRYQNDLAARLQDYGVQSAYGMGANDYANMLAANNAYYNAYGLGKAYSDVDQYNYQVKQYNSLGNQLAGLAGGVGSVLSTIPTPWTQGIGAGLQVIGNMGSLEAPSIGGTAARSTGVGGTGDAYSNIAKGFGATASLGGAMGANNWLTRLYGDDYTKAAQQQFQANLNKNLSNNGGN